MIVTHYLLTFSGQRLEIGFIELIYRCSWGKSTSFPVLASRTYPNANANAVGENLHIFL